MNNNWTGIKGKLRDVLYDCHFPTMYTPADVDQTREIALETINQIFDMWRNIAEQRQEFAARVRVLVASYHMPEQIKEFVKNKRNVPNFDDELEDFMDQHVFKKQEDFDRFRELFSSYQNPDVDLLWPHDREFTLIYLIIDTYLKSDVPNYERLADELLTFT